MGYKIIIDGVPFGKQNMVPNYFTRQMRIPEKTRDYMSYVLLLFQNQNKNYKTLQTPIHLTIDAYYRIPKVNKKTKQSMLSGEIVPTIKPDCDNISKVICDSLNNYAWVDDCQIYKLGVTKYYSDKPRVEVSINEIQ